MQIAPAEVQSLGLAAVMDCTLPLDAGGLLYYDTVHSVWLYEGDAVQARLSALKDVRPSRPLPTMRANNLCCSPSVKQRTRFPTSGS